MSENNTSAGSSGVSRPRRVISMMRQAMTRLMAIARRKRSALSWARSSMRRQDVGQAHGRAVRLVDHAVTGLDRRPVALGHATEGAIGHLCFGCRHADQSPAQTGIAQGGTAEFVLRPRIAFRQPAICARPRASWKPNRSHTCAARSLRCATALLSSSPRT